MATAANLKDALTHPADAGNPIGSKARTVGNAALLRLQAAIEGSYDLGRPANANDASRWLWHQAAGFVRQYERRVAEVALPDPTDMEG